MIASLNLESVSHNHYDETLEEALIDLYLSVKIRSNEEVSLSRLSNKILTRLTNIMNKCWQMNAIG